MMNISRIFESLTWHGFDEFGCNDPLVKLLTNEIDIFNQFLTLLNKSLEYRRQCKEFADVTFYWLLGGTLLMFISTKWGKVFKKGPSKIGGRQILKNLQLIWYDLLGPFLNTWPKYCRFRMQYGQYLRVGEVKFVEDSA